MQDIHEITSFEGLLEPVLHQLEVLDHSLRSLCHSGWLFILLVRSSRGWQELDTFQGVARLELGLLSGLCQDNGRWWAGVVVVRLEPVRQRGSKFDKFTLIVSELQEGSV